jgi:hypothetical protein
MSVECEFCFWVNKNLPVRDVQRNETHSHIADVRIPWGTTGRNSGQPLPEMVSDWSNRIAQRTLVVSHQSCD